MSGQAPQKEGRNQGAEAVGVGDALSLCQSGHQKKRQKFCVTTPCVGHHPLRGDHREWNSQGDSEGDSKGARTEQAQSQRASPGVSV